ncbi:phosphatase 2C-like domain-containing protein [Abortiporus biennis]|nr:phosphatase 2C-like domain-containing protein [Abortiporus biennis]
MSTTAIRQVHQLVKHQHQRFNLSFTLSLLSHQSNLKSTSRNYQRKDNASGKRSFSTSPTSFYTSLPRPYRFHVGASWAGKPPDPRLKEVKSHPFPSDSEIGRWRDYTLSRPKSSGGTNIGEDFFYIQEMRNRSGLSIGIADGVGGWVDQGIDPALFAQTLMFHASRYSKSSWAGEPEFDPTQDYEEREEVEGWELRPEECMELAHAGVLREKAVSMGSSTACILNFNASSGILRAANLGDSGFCIIRSSSCVYQQRPQTHYFNCPKQLAKLPIGPRGYMDANADSPRDANIYQTRVRDGDIIIVYTDGLSDNVFTSEITSICSLVSRQFALSPDNMGIEEDKLNDDRRAQAIADRLVDYAQMCMMSKTRASPFERAATRAAKYYRGGKLDDVTVLAVIVRESY